MATIGIRSGKTINKVITSKVGPPLINLIQIGVIIKDPIISGSLITDKNIFKRRDTSKMRCLTVTRGRSKAVGHGKRIETQNFCSGNLAVRVTQT
jgi:hypothetical protein